MDQHEDNFSQISTLQLPSTRLDAKTWAKHHTFPTQIVDNEVPRINVKFLTANDVDIPTKVEDDFSQKSWPPTRWSQHHAKSQVNSSDFKSEFQIDDIVSLSVACRRHEEKSQQFRSY